MKYRADIDGLRAIAVLLVIFYHAKLPVSGGFIGVDIFFVISGFLITSIIYKESLERKFSFKSFYLRRIKRLLPAYLFMLVPVSVYCFFFLMPDDLISFSKSIIYSLLAISNFFFYKGAGYFGLSSPPALLHTWSLAVEEQFYIIWPFLIFLFVKIKNKKLSTILILSIFAIALFISEYYALNHKNAAYLLIPFRFFELMAGAIIAIYKNKISETVKHNNLISIIGLVFILYSAFTISSDSIFPGLNAVPVCAGTVLLIISGLNDKGIVNKFLKIKGIVSIGKISYSLYLWHWPLIILTEYRGIELTTTNAIILILASIAIATISYLFIESPIRKNKKINFVFALSVFYLIPIFIFIGYFYVVTKNDGFRARSSKLADELEERNTSHIIRHECIDKLIVGNIENCHLGVKKDSIDGVLLGDSFANAYAPFIDELAKDANIMIHDTTNSSTPVLNDVFVMSIRNKLPKDYSVKIMDYTRDRISFAKKYKIVIISVFWDQYDDRNQEYRIFNRDFNDITKNAYNMQLDVIKDLIGSGVKVYLIARPFSEIGNKEMNKLRQLKLRHSDISSIQYNYGEIAMNRTEYKIKNEIPEVILIDPNDVLCKEDKCNISIEGKLIYRNDGSHLNSIGAALIAKEYISSKYNPFK